jgi:hypothetical protein
MSKSVIAIDSFTDFGTASLPTNDGAIAPHTTSMAPHLSSFPVFIPGTERVQWFLIHSRSAVWIAEFLTRKPQTNLLPYLTILLPLAVGNGDDQVRLRETDEFRRSCVVTGCDTRSTDVAENHLTCKPVGVLQGFTKVHWHLPFGTLFEQRW